MSRKADVTFCKVAITAGLVSQEQAHKALALVDKQEQETGRRPLIGAVFTKYQLLTQEEVQRVNEAVAKRLGGTHPVVARTASSRKGGAKRRKPKRKPVDPKLLKQGIGFGILFLVVLIGIAIAYWMPGDEPEDDGSTVPGGGTSLAGGSGTPGTGSGGSAVSVPTMPTEELPREVSGRFMMLFNDIRRDVDDNPPRARKLLAKALKDLGEFEKRFIIPTDLVDLRRSVEKAVESAGALEDPRGSEATAGGADEPSPAEPEPAAAGDNDNDAATGDDDIEVDDGGLDDLDLDDLDLDDI